MCGLAVVPLQAGNSNMNLYTEAVLLGTAAGFLSRLYMLRTDYRNYPSYPHGYVIHLSLGLIAASLAALALPALLEKEYTAITFLVLCAQQFRDIRNMERETLMNLEENKLVPRGTDYIEGIAKVFESRNYLVMLVAMVTSGAVLYGGISLGVPASLLMILLARFLMRGSFIRDIARVEPGRLHFEKSLLYVDDIVIMNVGDPAAREKILKEGVGLLLHPYDDDGRSVLNSLGQRQALLHDISMLMGNKLEIGEPEWSPAARKNMETGSLALFLMPNEKDMPCLIEAAKRTPVLESAVQKPLASTVGRKAAD